MMLRAVGGCRSIVRAGAAFYAVMDREGRGTEFHMAKVLLLVAAVLLLEGNTLGFQTYAQLHAYGLSEPVLASLCLGLGLVRMTGLIINGYHHKTPAMRAVTSFISCLLFGALSYNVWVEYCLGGLAAPSVVMALYPAFVLAEFRAASRIRWERINAGP